MPHLRLLYLNLLRERYEEESRAAKAMESGRLLKEADEARQAFAKRKEQEVARLK